MAAAEDDNKLECISNVNKEQERYFLNVYKKHEYILNNKNESFESKVESLIDVWKSVGELNLCQFDIRHVIQIMDWAKLHALNIVLTAEWNAFKATHQSRLLQEIEKAQTELLKLNSRFATRCKKLADVVKNPWEDAVLMKLMKTKNAEIGPKEIEFFCVETAYVISVRLKKLCESQCEDLALNLVTAFMNCNKLSKSQNFSLNATESQMWFIFDIYIALLYKFQEKQKIVVLLKELSFEEGLQLVKRFAKKRVKISKIWKNCHRVAILATQMYISQAVVKYSEELRGILESYIEMYISMCNIDSLLHDFPSSIRRISNLADAPGLYLFCDVIQQKAGTTLKPFVIEMYIRALTTDMNELERQKDAKEKEKVTATTSRLAVAFCNLADFLNEHVKVARECVLTAFSLEPTKERLKNIEELAKRSGFQVLDTGQQWKCKLHPPVLPSDDIAWICPECGDWMCKPQLNIPLKINMALNEALQNSVLGISEALCDDLVVCLSNPRYQILSWFLPWDDLHRLCIMYLQDPQTTKNFVTELKFVDIDYSIFKSIKREPLDELAGIERGYEQYLDQNFVSDGESSSVSGDSVSQDSRPYSLGSDGAGEGPYLPLVLPQPKSDPNTLKSLRMFRPNLKRSRNTELGDNHPEKIHKIEAASNTGINGNPSNGIDVGIGSTSTMQDMKKAISLSNYLNGLGETSPLVALPLPVPSPTSLSSNNNETPYSKNVKAATLPPLGGQVAKKVTNPVQVKPQPQDLFHAMEKTYPTFKNLVDQALKPYNQSTSTISETTKRDLMLKLLSKRSLSGSKENNNYKHININNSSEKLPESTAIQTKAKCQTQACQTLPHVMDNVTEVKIPLCTEATNPLLSFPGIPQQVDEQNLKKFLISSPPDLQVVKLMTESTSPPQKCLKVSSLSETCTKVAAREKMTNHNQSLKIEEKTLIVPLTRKSISNLEVKCDVKGNSSLKPYNLSYSSLHCIDKVDTKLKNKVKMSSTTILQKIVSEHGKDKEQYIDENNIQNKDNIETDNLEDQIKGKPKNSVEIVEDGGIVSNYTSKSKQTSQNNNDYSSLGKKEMKLDDDTTEDKLPKNINLTEKIRTYIKKSAKRLPVINEDCVVNKKNKVDSCKNVNISSSISSSRGKPHSIVQKPQTNNRQLRVVLYRLPPKVLETARFASKREHHCIKRKCDRGKTPPKNDRKRKNVDKSENKLDSIPNQIQNCELLPFQDIDLRITPKEKSKALSLNANIHKLPSIQEAVLGNPRVLLERLPADNKSYARSVLANVPGLNDYRMIRPTNVNHIVNVVQVSGGRATQNVPIQSTQTSTQVSPHIQRIGQPRVAEQKPEHSNSITSTTCFNSTSTTSKTTTTQPSTLINILSQQIIRPVTTAETNTVRRPGPLINILSQQIIRPSHTQKAPADTVITAENNQVKSILSNNTEQSNVNSQMNNVTKNSLETKTTIGSTPVTTNSQGGSTILQFICKSSLPKFQQAFGKSVYQTNVESCTTTTSTVETAAIVADEKKNLASKTVPVNVQPIQGSVIYSRQMPVGQTISLIPPGATTRQVFRIATSNAEQISFVKDSVIHSKMSAFLAAALQGRQKDCEEQTTGDEKIMLTRPTLVQNARIVKPVQLQIPTNIRAPNNNLSSTTLEQLREFDMVYKQIKERSSSSIPAEASNSLSENQEVTQQRISVTYVNQLQKYTQLSPVVVVSSYNSLQPAASPALSVTSQGSSSPCVTPASTPTLPKIATKGSKGKTLKSITNNNTSKSSPIPKPQQKPQEDEHTTQRIFDILAEYAEQLRNSPDLNNKPAPRRRSNPPTNPSQNSKRKKSSTTTKKSGQSSSSVDIDTDDVTVGSEDSSGGGIVQLSVTDDEQSQAAATNTPESTENSSISSPSSSSRQLLLTEGSNTCQNQTRNLIIADSSVGEALKMPNTAVIVPGSYIMPVSMVKGGQQIAVVSGGSKILATVPARSGQNMLLFQSFMNQNRKGSISAVKYSTIQPISGISSQSLAGVSAQPPVILPSNSVATAVALGQPLTLKKLNDDRDNELLLALSQPKEDSKTPSDLQQPDSSTSVSSDSSSTDVKIDDTALQSESSNEKIFQTFQKTVITNSVATSVIATTSSSCKEYEKASQNIINMTLTSDNKVEAKSSERIQSVLVTACSSNGPMLSHSTPRYRKPSETGRTNNNDLPNKEDFLHNGEKLNNTEQKTLRGHVAYYTNKTKKIYTETQKVDSEMQKQAAMERELRLQKSLSEECEDLGVDEPSTSDLFPEADLLFDSNHSPSFDQSSQDIIKRTPQSTCVKEEIKAAMNLFSDDENSTPLRTDLFEYVEYQTVETELDYQARQLLNGTTGNESGSSGCEDNTLLSKCTTMSEVTLNSPISPELYTESGLNKYKFKYSNRKKGERVKQQNYFGGEVVSSSEDTISSTELGKVNCEDDSYKVVHVAITKTDLVKEEDKCELHCDEDLDSQSGRGARRSVRKLCSCCNGLQDGSIARKRSHSSRPQTPASPHKKAFLNKKR